jgi:hypothetical protein
MQILKLITLIFFYGLSSVGDITPVFGVPAEGIKLETVPLHMLQAQTIEDNDIIQESITIGSIEGVFLYTKACAQKSIFQTLTVQFILARQLSKISTPALESSNHLTILIVPEQADQLQPQIKQYLSSHNRLSVFIPTKLDGQDLTNDPEVFKNDAILRLTALELAVHLGVDKAILASVPLSQLTLSHPSHEFQADSSKMWSIFIQKVFEKLGKNMSVVVLQDFTTMPSKQTLEAELKAELDEERNSWKIKTQQNIDQHVGSKIMFVRIATLQKLAPDLKALISLIRGAPFEERYFQSAVYAQTFKMKAKKIRIGRLPASVAFSYSKREKQARSFDRRFKSEMHEV